VLNFNLFRIHHQLIHLLTFMGDINNLKNGKRYQVIRSFVDYDYITHHIGETWIFNKTVFLPYDDGLTLHVIENGHHQTYRFQWREEEQAGIIRDFEDYVAELTNELP